MYGDSKPITSNKERKIFECHETTVSCSRPATRTNTFITSETKYAVGGQMLRKPIFAFDEGKRLLFVYRTRHSNRIACHAILRFKRHLGPAWHTLPRSHVFSSFRPVSWYVFCDTRSQMKRWQCSVHITGLFIVFLAFYSS